MRIQNKFVSLVVASVLLVSGSLAHAVGAATPATAPAVTVTSSSATGPVGGQAAPTLTFTFDEIYDFTTLTFDISYNSAKLSFNEGLSTAMFIVPSASATVSLDELASLSGGDFAYSSFTSAGPGTNVTYTLIAGFAVASYPLPVGSSLVLTGVFDLIGLPLGQTTDVDLSGFMTSTVADADPLAVNDFSEIVTVSAVPEPETWLMMLCGVGLMAARVRRVRAHAAAVGTA